jgi:hypothetical protein
VAFELSSNKSINRFFEPFHSNLEEARFAKRTRLCITNQCHYIFRELFGVSAMPEKPFKLSAKTRSCPLVEGT